MLFTTEWLTTIFHDYNGVVSDSTGIEEVTSDSRNNTNKALFVPISGEKFDGHVFLKQAFDHGAQATLWKKEEPLPDFLPADFPVFFVEDTLLALQELACCYRDKVNPVVIGITGSNGKTTTKDIVAGVVKTTYNTHYTKGNLNNHIGVPLTILSMSSDTEVLVVEMGMNHAGEIKRLSEIAKPDIAIITNIGESHIEYLGSRAGIAKAKLEIIHGMSGEGCLIIDGDEALLDRIGYHGRVITCGFDANNDLVVEHVNLSHEQTQFRLSNGDTYTIPLLGHHHALNATYAVAVAKRLQITEANITGALASLQLTSMRFELLKGRNGVSVINDAYNASPTSMKAAINVVKQMKGFSQKVLVLGDIFELGSQSQAFHQSVAENIDESITALLTFGNDAREISLAVGKKHPEIRSTHLSSEKDLIGALENFLSVDTLILFKASRAMHFESFVQKIID